MLIVDLLVARSTRVTLSSNSCSSRLHSIALCCWVRELLHAAFSMASFAFYAAFVTITSAMSSIAKATEAEDWYLLMRCLGLGSSEIYIDKK